MLGESPRSADVSSVPEQVRTSLGSEAGGPVAANQNRRASRGDGGEPHGTPRMHLGGMETDLGKQTASGECRRQDEYGTCVPRAGRERPPFPAPWGDAQLPGWLDAQIGMTMTQTCRCLCGLFLRL